MIKVFIIAKDEKGKMQFKTKRPQDKTFNHGLFPLITNTYSI